MPSTPSTFRTRIVPTLARRPGSGAAPTEHGLAFAVFLVVNAFLFVRPSDVFDALLGVEIYQYVIGLCLLLSLPALIALFSSDRLMTCPATICVLCLFPIILVSSLVNVGPEKALDHGIEFAKILAYFLLLLALVTTPRRMQVFLSFLIVCAGIMALLSLLDFYHVVTLPRITELDGRAVMFEKDRLYGPGLFGDPNDLCTILAAMLILMLGLLTDKRAGSPRILWLVPGGLMAVAIVLTQSRGGLMALMVGLGLFIRLRFGWPRAIVLGLLGFPLLLLALGGRQTEFSAGTNTGQERIQLWSTGLVMFQGNPLQGVGLHQFKEFTWLLAHNSYIEVFAELGFFGGMFFLGATVLSIWGLYGLAMPRREPGQLVPVTPAFVDPTLEHLHPFVAGAVLAYAMGMFTLSLNMLLATYTVFGLAGAFLGMAVTRPPRPLLRFDFALLVRLGIIALVGLAAMFVFVRLTFSA